MNPNPKQTVRGVIMSDLPAPTGYDVYWEKWIDAFEEEEEISELQEEANLEEEFMGGEETPLPFEEEMFGPVASNIPSIITPFGILPLTEQARASNYFKLWVGHSNFKLTEEFFKIIGQSPGVEALDIMTPYRFRIAIGKLFVDRQIMKTVRDNMVSHMNGPEDDNEQKRE